jgi:crotonobetainyl-CoA:carnitine CoA-transferase CaiB-like acyl-CoA transferase
VTEAGGPLSDIVVLDLTQMLSGPFATMVLADLGADVIKVEPFVGDLTRAMGPHLPDDNTRHYGGYFASINRNKRSLALNLKDPRGVDVLKRMVVDADVVVENFRVGVMDRLGVGYESLRSVNPRLVYASLRGFGDPRTGESPYASWPAFDVTAQAMGGLMGITGPGPGQPLKSGPGVGDLIPALFLAVGTVAAVHHARLSGQGQMVDVAMYDAVLAVCERIVYQYSYTGMVPGPQGNTHPLLCPFDAFPAADGTVTIAAPADSLWIELTTLIGQPELGADPRFATNGARVRRAGEVRDLLSAWTSVRTKAEILDVLGGRVPCAPVNTSAEIFADPHVVAREMIVEVEHPGRTQSTAPAAAARIAGVPIKLTETPGGVRRRGPLLGEHTDDVLAQFGFLPDEIADLKSGDVLRSTQH